MSKTELVQQSLRTNMKTSNNRWTAVTESQLNVLKTKDYVGSKNKSNDEPNQSRTKLNGNVIFSSFPLPVHSRNSSL